MTGVKKRWRIIIAGLVLVLLGVLAWVVFTPGEPEYEGKPLSFWLAEAVVLHATDDGTWKVDHKKAEAAMEHFGTNAIPTLLQMLRARDSALKLKLLALGGKFGLHREPYQVAENRNRAAAEAFRQLRSSGKFYVPDLIKIYEEKISPASQLSVLAALDYIGPGAGAVAATPALINGLTNTNNAVRGETVQTLGYMWAPSKLAVPALAKCLSDPYVRVRFNAAHVLGGYRVRAESAIPALIAALNDANGGVRTEAEQAIMKIDGETYKRLIEQGKIQPK